MPGSSRLKLPGIIAVLAYLTGMVSRSRFKAVGAPLTGSLGENFTRHVPSVAVGGRCVPQVWRYVFSTKGAGNLGGNALGGHRGLLQVRQHDVWF